MNNISYNILNVHPGKLAVEYTAITALIAAFCVGAIKFGAVEALIAALCLSVLTEVSARLNVKFNPASNTPTGYRRRSSERSEA